MKKKIGPFLIFFPLLILYILIILLFSKENLIMDGERYVQYAENLTRGYYSLPYPNVSIINGPGYPLLLFPFVLFKIPLLYAKILNAFLLFLSVYFVNKSLLFYTTSKRSVISSYALGLYFPLFKYLPVLMTEIFTVFLISLIIYFILYTYKNNKFNYLNIGLIGFLMAYLALAKIIFGYVIVCSLIISILFFLIYRNKKLLYATYILLISMVFCIPYLAYTYRLTGEFFYWGNPGADSIYWMSSPCVDEYGDWYPIAISRQEWTQDKNIESDYKRFHSSHQNVIEQINKATSLQKDSIYYSQAFSNIKAYPEKYLKNWFANLGRMFFSYPFSYQRMKLSTYFTLIPNMFIFVILVLLLYPTLLFFRKLPIELVMLLFFFLIYLAGSSLVSANSRQFIILTPLILLYIVYMMSNIVMISFKK